MRVVFMGTPEFAVPTLQSLIEKHEVVAVITQPDKPKGRGKRVQSSPVKLFACEKNIPVLQPISIKSREFFEELSVFKPDIIVVVAYGQILPQRIRNLPKFGCINVHGSILPKYRGAAPVHWAIINGETTTGVTIMHMEKGIDTGDMILKRYLPIRPDDTGTSLLNKLSVIGAEAMLEALELIKSGKAIREKQNDGEACYAPMLTRETGRIDWHKSAQQIINMIRALDSDPSAYTTYIGEIIKLCKAEFVNESYSGQCGEIVAVIKNKGFVVKTGDGNILITEVQAPGGKRMKAADYMRGNEIKQGSVLPC